MSMMPLGDIAPLAKRQLAAWEAIAADWPTYEDGSCQRCVSCHVNIWRRNDQHGKAYQYTMAELLALVVAHLRQAHMDLDPDHG